MTTGRILFDSVLRNLGTILAFSGVEVAGFEKENAIDWRDFSLFRVSNLTQLEATLAADADIDTFSWYVKKPNDRIIIELQWEDGVNNFVQLASASIGTGFTDPLIGMKKFTKVTVPAGRRVRFVFSAMSVDEDIRQLTTGVRLDFPIGQHQGIRPPNLRGEFVQSNNISVNGSFIGRDKVRGDIRGEIDLEFLQPTTFVRDQWLTLMEHAEKFAFYYAWNLDDFPDEVVFAWARETPRPINSGPETKMSVNLPWSALAS